MSHRELLGTRARVDILLVLHLLRTRSGLTLSIPLPTYLLPGWALVAITTKTSTPSLRLCTLRPLRPPKTLMEDHCYTFILLIQSTKMFMPWLAVRVVLRSLSGPISHPSLNEVSIPGGSLNPPCQTREFLRAVPSR